MPTPATALLNLSIRRPSAVVAAIAAITIAGLVVIPRIELRLDGRSLVPAGHASMRGHDAAAGIWNLHDVIVVGLRHEAGIYTAEGVRRLVVLSRGLAACDGVLPQTVASLATVPRLTVRDDVLDLRSLVHGSDEHARGLAARVRQETSSLGFDNGVLAARDGRAAAVYAAIDPDADRDATRRCVADLASAASGRGYEVFFSGTAMAQAVLGEAAVGDLLRLIPFVLAILCLGLLAAFRRPLPVAVSLAEICVSLLWTAALMGLLRERVFVTTLSLPVILLVIGVTDDVYILHAYLNERRRVPGAPAAAAVATAFRAEGRAVLLTAATTIAGLLSLLATGLEPQRVFGAFGAFAVLCSTVFTFSLVPALLVLFDRDVPDAVARHDARRTAVLHRAFSLLEGAGWRRVLGAVGGAAAAAAVGAAWVQIDDSWVRNLPPSSDVARGDRAINESLAGTNTLDIMVDSGEPDGFLDPARLLAIGALEDALSASSHVGAVEGAYRDVVRVVAGLNGVPYEAFRRELRAGRRTLTRSDVEQAVVVLESVAESPMVAHLDDTRQRARLTAFMQQGRYSSVADVLELLPRSDNAAAPTPRVVPFGDAWVGYQAIHLIVVGQMRSIAFAVLSNLVLLTIVLRSLPVALIAIAPALVTIVLVLAGMGMSGLALGTASSMFTAIALGVGGDYAIHLVAVCRDRIAGGEPRRAAVLAALLATGPAIVISGAALAAGFLTLGLSDVVPNRDLGVLISGSMLASAAFTIVLVPALMLSGRARHVR